MTTETPIEASKEIDAAHQRVRSLLCPPPSILPSEWGERNIYLRKGTTPRPGNLVLETYQREILDCYADPDTRHIVCVKPTQIGWSVLLNILAGYTIDIDPKPLMMVMRTRDNARDYGKKRLKPLFEDCPALNAKIRPSRSRKAGSTLMLKEFPGGFLKLAGANAGSDLLSDPVPVLIMDERDGYPADVQGEGEPGEVAINRTASFPDSKVLEGGTPAKPRGISRLEKSWDKSDKRRFHVNCPHCNKPQVLWWRDPDTKDYRLVYEVSGETGEVDPSTVRYICKYCSKGIKESSRRSMLQSGRWIAERPGRSIIGFHINALYRPWKDSWCALAQKWEDIQGDQDLLKEFVTLQLGEFWDDIGTNADSSLLISRAEKYESEVPENVAMLVMSADTQDNRIEANVWGFGPGEEAWLIDRDIFWGDPSSDAHVWDSLEKMRLKEYRRADGIAMRPMLMGIDSQGHNTDAVYDWVIPRQRSGVFALRGVDYHSRPVLVSEGAGKNHRVKVFTIAVSACKDLIYSRLRIPADRHGPKFIHFPDWCDQEYFDQLVSEKKITVKDKKTRKQKQMWVKIHNRNEQLDLCVYAFGLLWMAQNLIAKSLTKDLDALLEMTRGKQQIQHTAKRRVHSSM